MATNDRTLAAALKAGFAALNAGDANAAAGHCREALTIDPKNPEAHFLVGLTALEMQDLKTATSAFGSVTKLTPGHAAAWAQLARAFMRMGQPVRAEQALAQAVAADSKDPAVEDIIGLVSSLLGDQLAARKWYSRAAEKAPDQPGYAVNLANAMMFLGDTGAAEETLTALLKKFGSIPQAEWLLSSIKKADDGARADQLLARAKQTADPASSAFLAYAAGKEYEDCENWDAAFDAFETGAQSKRKTVEYKEAGEEAMFAALREVFSPQWAAKSREGCDDPSPIFVVGQPRTGTTLIERIITSHSMVESAGELQQFGLSVRRLAKGDWPERISAEAVHATADIDAKALGAEYLRASVPMRKGAPRFVDKLPGNYLNIPLILAALPNARIVHLTRNPLDSCFSSYKQLFADAYLHSYDQAEMARHHVRYAALMNYWREVFPGRFLDISYEETVADVEPYARQLIEFLGLAWEDACLEFYRRADAVTTASAVQVREKPHTRSVGRWRRYEQQLAPMRAILSSAGLINEAGDSKT